MSLNQMMQEFMTTYNVEEAVLNGDNLRNMLSLSADEMVELEAELYASPTTPIGDEVLVKSDAIKEALDVVYVMTQRLVRMGVDVDASLEEVHRSNMSKVVYADQVDEQLAIAIQRYPHAYVEQLPTGDYALRDLDTAKVIKPTTYSPATLVEGVHYDIN